ncbi:MAG: VWA domain-containing protein [Gammaproteobacteria bacterium]|nr:VWA domain-containing protein [Gammaproteobacteria bacterium]
MAAVTEATVELVDAQRLLSLFAQGMGGRFLHLRPVADLKGQFRFEPLTLPTSDGAALYLPEQVDRFDVKRHNLGVYKIAILHQLGFFEFGTFEFSLAEAHRRISGFEHLVLERELVDDVDFDVFFRAFPVPRAARQIFHVLEDHRIDCAIHRFYPGVRDDLERIMSRSRLERGEVAIVQSAGELLEALLQYTLGAERESLESLDVTALLPPILDLADRLRTADADVYTTVAATVGCYELLAQAGISQSKGHREVVDIQDDDLIIGPDALDGLSEGSAPMDDALLTPEGVEWRGEFQPELVQRRLRLDALELSAETLEQIAGAAPMDAIEALMEDVEIEILGELEGEGKAVGREPGTEAKVAEFKEKLRRRIERDRSKIRMAFGNLSSQTRSFLYDEWNFHDQVYMKGWCRLFEQRLVGDDLAQIEAMRQKHRALFAKVRQQFQYVKPQSYQRIRRVLDGEDIDLESAVEARVDRLIGRTPDERVYMRRDKMRREVAAAFLVDLSASTDDPVPEPQANEDEVIDEPVEESREVDPFLHDFYRPFEGLAEESARRRIIDLEKESVVLMCDALEVLGDSYAIYGFSGYGHEEVEFYVAKEFEQGLSASVLGAIAAMKPHRSTRMGPAIRHSIRKLERQDARLKVLIILSDGYPQDWDYGPDRTDNEFGIQDTAKALEEAARAGIETFCITIDPSGHDYLRRMCPDRRYLVIDQVETLPGELSKVYRALTV